MQLDKSISSADLNVVKCSFGRDLNARRTVQLALPEFLLLAIEARLLEANEGADEDEMITLDDFVEAELIGVVSLHDVATLDRQAPGFAQAVSRWLASLDE